MMRFFRNLLNLLLKLLKPEPEPQPEPEPEPEPQPEPEPEPNVIRATRVLPDTYVDGTPIKMSIDVVPASTTVAWALEDALPSGWVASNMDHGGAWDNVNKKAKWGLFFDQAPMTLHATLTPAGNNGPVTFNGVVSADGVSYPIQGQNQINQ